MRVFSCEICGRKIDETHRTLSTEFPMIYSGEITICGDLCKPCRDELQARFNQLIKSFRREMTA